MDGAEMSGVEGASHSTINHLSNAKCYEGSFDGVKFFVIRPTEEVARTCVAEFRVWIVRES